MFVANGDTMAEQSSSGCATLLDAQITGDIIFRTSSGRPLDTRLDQSQLHAEAADKPLRFAGSGSYNGTPVQLEADFGSLDTLRDATIPYPTEIYATSGDTTLHFHGTMTEPLDVDGAKGRIELIAPTRRHDFTDCRRVRRLRRGAPARWSVRARWTTLAPG